MPRGSVGGAEEQRAVGAERESSVGDWVWPIERNSATRFQRSLIGFPKLLVSGIMTGHRLKRKLGRDVREAVLHVDGQLLIRAKSAPEQPRSARRHIYGRAA